MNKSLIFFVKHKAAVLFSSLAALFVFFPVLSKTPAHTFVHEHFFNTLRIVENMKTAGFPSFDSVVATNDFSPVWGGLLWGLSLIVSAKSAFFFVAVRLVIVLSGAAALFLIGKLMKRLSFAPSDAALFFIQTFFIVLFLRDAAAATGSFLAIPAVFLTALGALEMLEKPSLKTGLLCGLSVCLATFIQQDTLGFSLTFALVFYFQFNGKVPVTVRDVFKFLPGLIVGLCPLYAWAAYLTATFGTPVAQTYRSWYNFQTFEPWNALILYFWYPIRHFSQKTTELFTLMAPLAICLWTAVVSMPKEAKNQTPRDTVFLSLLWFPLVQFGLFTCLTYAELPTYAHYPLAVGAPFALAFLFKKMIESMSDTSKEIKQMDTSLTLISGILFFLSLFLSIQPLSAAYLPIAATVDAFSQENGGVYAMGKGAGITSYTAQIPLVRADGLAMDTKMADAGKQARNLADTLKEYGTDYYIGLNVVPAQECYLVSEPAKTSLGNIKSMGGWLCAAPVFEKQIYPNLKLSVFDLNREEKKSK